MIDPGKAFYPINQRATDDNVFLELDGRKTSIIQWSKIARIPPQVIRQRLKENWDVREAIWTPIDEQELDL